MSPNVEADQKRLDVVEPSLVEPVPLTDNLCKVPTYEPLIQPETRQITQEQLVAEVKGKPSLQNHSFFDHSDD